MRLLALASALSFAASFAALSPGEFRVVASKASSPSVVWTDALSIGVGGRPFPANTGNLSYARWPAAAEADLNPGEWSWGLASAGLFVQFFSDATAIHVNYTLRDASTSAFSNFAPIAFSGVDLCMKPTTRWRGGGRLARAAP